MALTVIKGLQSEIFVPSTPAPVWTPVKKELKDMVVALVTGAGIHEKEDKKFNLAGDSTFRIIKDTSSTSDLAVSHGGYDNTDVNRDINSMFPLDRLHELEEEGLIKSSAPLHISFMGGGGDQEILKKQTGPKIGKLLLQEGVDAVLMTAG